MNNSKIESYVNCPECRTLVKVELNPYQDFMGLLTGEIERSIGIENTEHFEGLNKCKCGKLIITSLHVTCISEGE